MKKLLSAVAVLAATLGPANAQSSGSFCDGRVTLTIDTRTRLLMNNDTIAEYFGIATTPAGTIRLSVRLTNSLLEPGLMPTTTLFASPGNRSGTRIGYSFASKTGRSPIPAATLLANATVTCE